MNKPGILSGIGDELKKLGTDTIKSVASEPKDLAKKVAQQIGIEREPGSPEATSEKAAVASEEANNDFLKALYGSSQEGADASAVSAEQQNQVQDVQAKQEAQQTHNVNYYQPLIEKIEQERKTPEEQERPADRVERLKMEDLEEKKEKEKEPLAVVRGKNATETKAAGSG